MPVTAERLRRIVGEGHRLVVKVGSSSLTASDGGHLDLAALSALVDVLAARRAAGHQVVLVSSGAIAAGIGPLGLPRRPSDLATQQAAASVGQGALVAAYQAAFSAHGLTVGQVLLTADDVTRRTHYTNARRTLERLLELGIVPIVNENDTVATHEIRFGDNDRLAALVSDLVAADGLVLLTDVDALYDGPPSEGRLTTGAAGRDDRGPRRRDDRRHRLGGRQRRHGDQGGGGRHRGSGRHPDVVDPAAGRDGGAVGRRPRHGVRAGRRRPGRRASAGWRTPRRRAGRLLLDDGAVAAVTVRRKSLLPAGITGVEGAFAAGDPVDVCTPDGSVIARGLVNYASAELPRLLGRSTRDLARELGPAYEREVIHRDDLVVL